MYERAIRYLGSRKNIAGMAGAVVGAGLHIAGLVGDLWPAVAVGLYGVAALVTPGERGDDSYGAQVRASLDELYERVRRDRGRLPMEVPSAIERMLGSLRLVLDRLDGGVDGRSTDLAQAPERLATVAEIVETSLPACLDTYVDRPPSSSVIRAQAALVEQLGVIARAVDRLVAEVPDVHADSAEALTEDLRRRYGDA
jgi:hypothetical protein